MSDWPHAEIEGATVHVDVASAQDGWAVTVLVTRPPAVGIDAADIEVELLDAEGKPLPLLDRPRGALTDAGGSLAATATAVFRFAATTPPRTAVVHWMGRMARFAT